MSKYRILAYWLVLSAAAANSALGQASSGDGIGKPVYTTRPVSTASGNATQSAVPARTLATIPYWSGSFQSPIKGKGQVFPYTMVGTDPAAGSATTVVPTNIVPISLSFSSGTRLDGSTRVQSVIASPIFQSFYSQAGFTQYADAIYRASFFKIVEEKSPSWHVLLSQPAVLGTQYINVPTDKGLAFTGSHSGVPIGLMDVDWFTGQLRRLVSDLKLDPHALTIFLTDNAFLFVGNPAKCCIVGFHSGLMSAQADSTQLRTFVWASYNDPKIFDAPLQDVTALSHEIGEWYSDPFLSNVVPSWALPGSKACAANILEVGDPIEVFHNMSFPVLLDGTSYHPQDAVLFSWFARQTPSIGIKGRYSYRGDKLFSAAPPCL
jgi:hypothetical protein